MIRSTAECPALPPASVPVPGRPGRSDAQAAGAADAAAVTVLCSWMRRENVTAASERK